jgi:hypothetical protein
MNIDVLGNAADYFKGALLRRLLDEGLLRDLAIDPLVTDAANWDTAADQLYAEIVGCGASRIRRPGGFREPRQNRRPIGIEGHTGDIFLDPDIGVQNGQAKDEPWKYVEPEEIRASLVGSRIVGVYQSKRRIGTRTEAAGLSIDAVVGPLASIAARSYIGGEASILFFSKDRERISALTRFLATGLPGRLGRIFPPPEEV